ncbi:MAG: hypothetical protein R3250_14830, partial [Melioribacteraceae bacterium]|nr:hypothetical protein [Melioribacteraceae bacterium]
MDVFRFESLKTQLLSDLEEEKFPYNKLSLAYDFLSLLTTRNDKNLNEAYFQELSGNLHEILSTLNVCGINPELVKERIT